MAGQNTARYNLVIKYFSMKSNNVSFVSCDIPVSEKKSEMKVWLNFDLIPVTQIYFSDIILVSIGSKNYPHII